METPGDLGDNVETFDDDHDEQTPAETVPHSSSSHREWRPEYELLPPEPDDPVSTRRRFVAKRPPTAAEEEEFRQKRKRPEPVPVFFH